MSFFCRTVEAQKMSGCMALDIDIHSPYSAKIFPCELTVAQHVERSTKGSAEYQVISMTLSPQSYTVLETLDPGPPKLFLCNRIDIYSYTVVFCVCGLLIDAIYAWPLPYWQVALLRHAACSKDLGPSCAPSKMAKHAGRKGVVEYSWRKACLTVRTKQIEPDIGLCLTLLKNIDFLLRAPERGCHVKSTVYMQSVSKFGFYSIHPGFLCDMMANDGYLASFSNQWLDPFAPGTKEHLSTPCSF